MPLEKRFNVLTEVVQGGLGIRFIGHSTRCRVQHNEERSQAKKFHALSFRDASWSPGAEISH